jgi:predicted nucleic acid-binding protein
LRAIDLAALNKLGIWDAAIFAAAGHAECDILFTEDLHDRQIIDGVKIVNPFK